MRDCKRDAHDVIYWITFTHNGKTFECRTESGNIALVRRNAPEEELARAGESDQWLVTADGSEIGVAFPAGAEDKDQDDLERRLSEWYDRTR